MREVQAILKCTLLAALASLALYAVLAVRTATQVIAGLPGQLSAASGQLRDEVAAARIDAFAEIAAARAEVLAKSDARIGDALRRVDAAIAEIDQVRIDAGPVVKHAGELVAHVDGAVQDGRKAAGELRIAAAPAAADAGAFVKSARAIADGAADTAALFLDCDHNSDCAFNRFQGTSKAVETTMQQVALAARQSRDASVQTTENVAGITTDLHTLTTAATKPKSFWGKVWGGITVLSRFAGLL